MITQMKAKNAFGQELAFGSISGTTGINKRARRMNAEARSLAEIAEQERRYAEAAMGVAHEAVTESARSSFSAIAKWHFERAADSFSSAATKLASARDIGLQSQNRDYLDHKISIYRDQETTMRISALNAISNSSPKREL